MKELKTSLKHWLDICRKLNLNKGKEYKGGFSDTAMILKNTVINYGGNACSLCGCCSNCVINFYAEDSDCRETPWQDLYVAVRDNFPRIIHDKIIEYAEMEYIFLLNIYYAEGGK